VALAWLLQDINLHPESSLQYRFTGEEYSPFIEDFQNGPDIETTEVKLFKTWDEVFTSDPAYDTVNLIQDLSFALIFFQQSRLHSWEAFLRRHLSEQDATLVLLYLQARSGLNKSALQELKLKADQEPPILHANLLMGLHASTQSNTQAAFEYYAKEAQNDSSDWARELAVRNRLATEDYTTLEELAQNPRFDRAISPGIRSYLAANQRDWAACMKWILLSQIESPQWASFGLATIAMLVWAIILTKLCRQKDLNLGTLLLCAFGLVLGMLSTTLTLFWIYLEEAYLPIQEGETIIQGLAYFIATVGLREEICKLLLFLPTLPFLLKRGRELEWLLTASFVGLGFAYEENFSYLDQSMGTAVAARLLTANFLHITTTGLSGLYLCRALDRGRNGWNNFLAAFGLIIIVHGAYDALLTYPIFGDDFSFLAMIVFILLSRYYFQEAHALRLRGEPAISMTATLMFGLSLTLGLLLIYLSVLLNLSSAFTMTTGSFVSAGIILFMFVREFDERI